jgi:RNA processing factor Prp31
MYAAIVNIEFFFAEKKITGNQKKLMKIGTRLMVTIKKNKINYEKAKIETHLVQINKSLSQIDTNVDEMVQTGKGKDGKFF